MIPYKIQTRHDVLQFLLTLGVMGGLLLAGQRAYESFKYAFWSQADAVVETVEPTCRYYRGRLLLRSGSWADIDCDAKADAAKLIAEGYGFTGMWYFTRVTYEAEPGRKTYARLSSWPEGRGPPKPGDMIRIRYSEDTPSLAEPVSDPDNSTLVTGGLIIVFTISAYVIVNRRWRKEPVR